VYVNGDLFTRESDVGVNNSNADMHNSIVSRSYVSSSRSRSLCKNLVRHASTSSNAKGADRSEKLLAAVKAKADEYKEALDQVSPVQIMAC
jgi:hypothetical protein